MYNTPTCVWVIQAILEFGEGWPQGIRELEKNLVHDQNSLLPQVGLTGAHESQDIIGQVPVKVGGRRGEKESRYWELHFAGVSQNTKYCI